MFAGSTLEREPGHPGRDRGRQVARGDIESGGEPGEVEADTTAHRDHVTLEARADPERRHGNVILAREGEDLRDGLGRLGIDDEVGPVGCVEGEVGRVQVALGVAVADACRADRSRKCVA